LKFLQRVEYANALRAAVCEHDAWPNIPPKANRQRPDLLQPLPVHTAQSDRTILNKIKHYVASRRVTMSPQKNTSQH
jgi:hypothetical protein